MYTCGYVHVYKEVLSVSTRKGTDKNVSLHNMGSDRHVWMHQRPKRCQVQHAGTLLPKLKAPDLGQVGEAKEMIHEGCANCH